MDHLSQARRGNFHLSEINVMSSLKQILFTSLLVLTLFGTARSQDNVNSLIPKSSLAITAAASGERLRITAPSSIVQMHVEVYAASGEKLFDGEIRGGNVFDWHLQDGQAQRLTAGVYLCVVTVKNISGRLTQKIGTVRVGEKDVSVGSGEVAQLSAQQTQAIGPVEENSSWTVLNENENQTTTVIAHDGTDGQIVRGRGAFSFRIGDFFSGSDKEQMRLTEEGNLGIGTAKPEFKLDVAGTIRARQGFVFNDGSSLNVNDKGILTHTSPDGTVTPNVGGIGSQGRLAKWTDNSGTLGDSVALDTGTGLQLTAAPNGAVDTNLLYLNSTNGTTGVLAGSTPSYGAVNGPFFAMRGNTYTTIANQRGLFTIAAGNIANPQGDDGSVKFNTGNDLLRMVIRPMGNVGIGTTIPGAKLDVAGDINTSTEYDIGYYRVLSTPGTNTFVGVDAGLQNTTGGENNAFFGLNAGTANTTGGDNSFFGAAAGAENKTGCCNSFFGTQAGKVNTGGTNSFFGWFAGSGNTAGSNNAYFGADSGDVATGSENSFFGALSGLATTSGHNNTFIGIIAGHSNTVGDSNTVIGSAADVASGNLDHATAIGADAVVSTSNTIALGRADGSDTVDVPGKLQIDTLAVAGSTQLCLNGSSRVGPCSSSLRYKTGVQPFFGGLNIVNRLRSITFTWKDGGLRDLGLGAEEVAGVEPLLTFRNKQGEIEGVRYNQLSAVFVNAFKQQQRQIRQQQNQIKQQETRLTQQQAELSQLKRLVCRSNRRAGVCK